MTPAAVLIALVSVLFPSKTWYTPGKPMTVTVRNEAPVSLIVTDFSGKSVEPRGATDVPAGEQSVDLLQTYPQLAQAGTYVLYAVPPGQPASAFVGTPQVISVRQDRRLGAPTDPLVTKIVPLQYAVIETSAGNMTLAFYYDVAPDTTENFQSLGEGGFYDGLTFHRVITDFIIQGGDPRADGTGGPGYTIAAEFNDRPHQEGVLSMARQSDPEEAPGVPPRAEFANSAGSQFFICLNYEATQQLDGRYTAFAKVVEGLDIVKSIGSAPLAQDRPNRPEKPVVINKVSVIPVTRVNNPYNTIVAETPATQPSPVPAGE